MSGRLVGNGSRLYRRNGSLVRSPIVKTISILPDSQAYYSVCGVYTNGIPTRGFIGRTGSFPTREMCLQGKMMRKSYLGLMTPTAGVQRWRDASGNIPRFIFYQGLYAPSGASTFAGEAYMQTCAYHFTIPSEYNGFSVSGLSLTLTHGGTILEYSKGGVVTTNESHRPYYTVTAPTSLLPADSNWRGQWVQRFGVFSDLNSDAHTMYDSLSNDENVTLNTNVDNNDFDWWESSEHRYGTGRASPIFGTTGVTYADDGIPISFNPWSQSFNMSTSSVGRFDSLRGGWIVGLPNVGVSTNYDTDNDNDYPFFYDTGHNGRWLCCSYWGFRVSVTLNIT